MLQLRNRDTRKIYRRREYSEAIINIVNGDPEFHEKVITSDEAAVDLNGFVDKRNSRYRGGCWKSVYCSRTIIVKRRFGAEYTALDVIGPILSLQDDNEN